MPSKRHQVPSAQSVPNQCQANTVTDGGLGNLSGAFTITHTPVLNTRAGCQDDSDIMPVQSA